MNLSVLLTYYRHTTDMLTWDSYNYMSYKTSYEIHIEIHRRLTLTTLISSANLRLANLWFANSSFANWQYPSISCIFVCHQFCLIWIKRGNALTACSSLLYRTIFNDGCFSILKSSSKFISFYLSFYALQSLHYLRYLYATFISVSSFFIFLRSFCISFLYLHSSSFFTSSHTSTPFDNLQLTFKIFSED